MSKGNTNYGANDRVDNHRNMRETYDRAFGLTNFEKILAIKEWQEDEERHPLTCTCGDHILMHPTTLNGKVVLECKICGRVQENVPCVVYNSYTP